MPFFSICLKMETGRALTSGVHKIAYPDNLPDEENLLAKIKDRTAKEVTELIHSFSTKFVDSLIESFNLGEFYKDKYEDKNVLYSVKKWWETKEPHVTWRTNFDNYYDAKANEPVPTRKPLWEALVRETVQHDNSKELIDYLFGAQERVKQLIFAADLIKDIGSRNKTNNDSQFAVSFHVFHFISLVKSLSDNLAWIIDLYCKMNLFEKRIDLVRKGVENCLFIVDEKLYSLIYHNPHFQNLVIIKSFRDITHHKHAIHAETVKMGLLKLPKQ